ncbi:invasion associated locus B family protein [Ruegeria sp. EL01]|jgi:invasion protein IalB|uniref:invasion associated locus B family protein n=1 Tax=Ruegeria sp. EL01 TaxID=2107578 RepID=UPI000EA83071|nr:invasion associated locus B family protein [Ruegeria sp. EL01]
MITKVKSLVLGAIALGVSLSAAVAQTKETTSTQFQSWTVNCAEEAGQKLCAMSQSLNLQNQSGLLLRMELQRGQEDGASGVVIVPFGLDIAKGISLSIDGGPRWNLPMRTCQNFGCVIPVTLGPAIIQELKESGSIQISLYTLDGGKTLEVPVSLAGFTAAFDAL